MKITRVTSLIVAVTIILTVLAGCALNAPKRLNTPVITLNDGVITWDKVEGAMHYEVDNGEDIIILYKTVTSYKVAVGMTVRVRATGDGVNYLDSYWSLTVTNEGHKHVDINRDNTCDNCGEVIDKGDHTHSDANGDNICDTCGVDITPPHVHTDANNDNACDECGSPTGVTHTHTDEDEDGICDTCENPTGQEHKHMDKDENGICDTCSKPTDTTEALHVHRDDDENDVCDTCFESVIVIIDIFSVNDLHGKFCDTSSQPGVDELATLLKSSKNETILLSSGDMWQGTAESNLTGGKILTEWMNALGFASMTLGNHEFDWGEDAIRQNLAVAEFPFLAINVYNKQTNKLADYCTPSVFVDLGDVEVGIIGAIGDCYSSISSDRVENVYFKTGDELATLVENEAARLRTMGADLIIYALHDGYDNSGNKSISTSSLSYYSDKLSDDVDIIFEGHSHQSYILTDSVGDKHLQGGGENSGISHAVIHINSVSGKHTVKTAEVIKSSSYSGLADDPQTEAIEEKYADVITKAYSPLGNVSTTLSSSRVADEVARLYLEAGLERWGDKYNIVLGGGFIKPRSPYKLTAGTKCYADVLSLLPFDNQLVLCKISGSKLSSRFINTDNSDYHNAYSDYGNSVKGSIKSNETYYVVVDTYTMLYAYNGLTPVEYYDDGVYARDLFADAIKRKEFE